MTWDFLRHSNFSAVGMMKNICNNCHPPFLYLLLTSLRVDTFSFGAGAMVDEYICISLMLKSKVLCGIIELWFGVLS